MRSRGVLTIFGLLSLSLYLLESVLTIDFGGSLLVIALQLDLFAFLILWHVGLGVIAPMLREEVWDTDSSEARYDQSTNELSSGFLPLWIRFLFPVVVLGEVLILMRLMNDGSTLGDYLMVGLYLFLPTLLLLYRNWIVLFLSVLWTWFPIEYGVIDQSLGNVELSLIPLDALLGIFSLLWPLIVHGHHIPWYDWQISSDDLMVVGKVSAFITIAIVPLGILTNFITINPDNLLDPEIKVSDITFLNSLVYAILVFYLIFLVQGLMEETLFRDIIFKHQYYWLKDRFHPNQWGRFDLGHVLLGLAGVLVVSIPFWDDLLAGLASLFPVLEPVEIAVGNMALPLGEYEGRPIPAFENYPLWFFYLGVAFLLVGISIIIYQRNHTPLMVALLVSSIIFGFAHFQDFRYVFFASIAGFGYGYTYYKTKNLVPAAMVHMGVDAIWTLLLTY